MGRTRNKKTETSQKVEVFLYRGYLIHGGATIWILISSQKIEFMSSSHPVIKTGEPIFIFKLIGAIWLVALPNRFLSRFFLKISWSAQNSLSFRRENVHPFYRRNRSTLCKNLFEKTLRILHNSPPSTNCSWFWSAAGISWSPLLPPSLARNSLNNFKSYSFLLRINILLRGEWRHRYPHEWGGI